MTARHLQRQCADRGTSARTLVAAAAHRAARDISRQFPGSLASRDGHSVGIRNAATQSYGRCLRPALYSSLRSSPSHPRGVSALRVTIAIANARKQWGLRKSTAKSRRLICNESATSQRVRAGTIEGSSTMIRTCRKSPQVPTGRWRDKRPQCAARSVGCLCCYFSSGPQCAASARNVRSTINPLHGFCIPHIVEAGHG